jgi:hypothetical protein
VDVGDRGADIYEAMVAAQTAGHDFLFRVTQNRQVGTNAACDEWTKLRDYAGTLPSQGRDVVEIPGRGGRAAREAEVELAAAPVWIPAPLGTKGRAEQPVVAAWVVRIWEAHPPKGVEGLIENLIERHVRMSRDHRCRPNQGSGETPITEIYGPKVFCAQLVREESSMRLPHLSVSETVYRT